MAVIRVEKSKNYTTMSNFHLRDKRLSLKAKGLMSLILSLPDNWNYSIAGLAAISKETRDGIGTALRELEANGYVTRSRLRRANGTLGQVEYVIYEHPMKDSPVQEKPAQVSPAQAKPAQLNTKGLMTKEQNKEGKKGIHSYGSNGHRQRAGPNTADVGLGFEDYNCDREDSY